MQVTQPRGLKGGSDEDSDFMLENDDSEEEEFPMETDLEVQSLIDAATLVQC